MKTIKWVDGKKYKDIPSELQKYFGTINPISGFGSLQNVGAVIIKGNFHLFLPKNTAPDSVDYSDIQLLINILTAYHDKTSSLGNGTLVQTNDLFPIVEWLIKDFTRNGLLLNTNKVTKRQYNGKISWNKTIKSILPMTIHDEPVLTEFYKTKSFVKEDFLTIIQKSVLSEISTKYGALFKFSYNVNKSYDLTNERNKKETVTLLTKLLRYVNEIRKRQLIKQLIAYIETQGSTQQISIVTTEFHVIFEHAMKAYFHHNKGLEKHVPKAHWNITINDRHFSPINNQIPDALVLYPPYVHIYDAKYYNFNEASLSNAYPPLDWYSVGKQFFYSISFDYRAAHMKCGTNNLVFPVYPLKHDYQEVGTVSISNEKISDINVIQANTFKLLQALI